MLVIHSLSDYVTRVSEIRLSYKMLGHLKVGRRFWNFQKRGVTQNGRVVFLNGGVGRNPSPLLTMGLEQLFREILKGFRKMLVIECYFDRVQVLLSSL